MAEQQQTNPEAVHALAAAVNPIQWGGGGNDLKARMVAEAILADPGPLLEALAQGGVLEVEHGERRDAYKHDGGGCFSAHYYPYARLVSPWKPVSES